MHSEHYNFEDKGDIAYSPLRRANSWMEDSGCRQSNLKTEPRIKVRQIVIFVLNFAVNIGSNPTD
jgi:hypothetical protein